MQDLPGFVMVDRIETLNHCCCCPCCCWLLLCVARTRQERKHLSCLKQMSRGVLALAHVSDSRSLCCWYGVFFFISRDSSSFCSGCRAGRTTPMYNTTTMAVILVVQTCRLALPVFLFPRHRRFPNFPATKTYRHGMIAFLTSLTSVFGVDKALVGEPVCGSSVLVVTSEGGQDNEGPAPQFVGAP